MKQFPAPFTKLTRALFVHGSVDCHMMPAQSEEPDIKRSICQIQPTQCCFLKLDLNQIKILITVSLVSLVNINISHEQNNR